MTKHIGPPLRFKAVNVETGEEFAPLDLNISVQGDDGKQRPLIIYDDYLDYNGPVQLCQSTGLHDRKGAEIFFGDVALIDDGEDPVLLEVSWNEDSIQLGDLDGQWENGIPHNPTMGLTIIGNRWMPIEKLEKRAKEILGE